MRTNRPSLAALMALVAGLSGVGRASPLAGADSLGSLVGSLPRVSVKNRSKYTPHQGARECARRRRQMGLES